MYSWRLSVTKRLNPASLCPILRMGRSLCVTLEGNSTYCMITYNCIYIAIGGRVTVTMVLDVVYSYTPLGMEWTFVHEY